MISEENLLIAIDNAMEHIPEQGPLEYFVHHNSIHHYQHLDFAQAVKKAATDYQCQAFMPEEFYWREYGNRGIHKTDLYYEIDQYIERHQIELPRHIIYNLLIQKETANHYLKSNENHDIRRFFMEEKNLFYKAALQEEKGVDIDHFIAPQLFKFLASYYDFGSAYWKLNNRQDGMWQAFCRLYANATRLDSTFLSILSKEIKKYRFMPATQALHTLVKTLHIPAENLNEYFFELALRFKGWAGLIKSLIQHPEWIKTETIQANFIEFLSIVVLCESAAIQSVSNNLPSIPKKANTYLHSEQFIHHFFYELCKNHERKAQFLQALPLLDDKSRQELLHKAFERTFYNGFFNTYVTQPTVKPQAKAQYQVICCLDEREESFRRYLEQDSACETFGHAGHFGLNIHFKGYFDKHPRALCPIVTKAEYEVSETGTVTNSLGLKSLFVWGELLWLSALSSKTLLQSSFQSFLSCCLTFIPFSLDIISPNVTAKIKRRLSAEVNNTVHTELIYKKEDSSEGMDLATRIQLAYNLLSSIGLLQQFGEFIIIVGHGSSSLNNPHEAAYDCGACGGGRGGPNARLMAQLLNEQAVREGLQSKQINIPKETVFIGAYHNTCSDDMAYYDIDESVALKFSVIQQQILKAAQLNAKERCRRFASVPFGKAPTYYHRKVRERALDLRQPRPEYGHSTNALCIIGPRSHSKQLFLDRRSFLISYDPYTDKDGLILDKILNNAGPVCAGINLEYYFSYIDNETYGCGTKLPHNVTSLIGVMNGYLSDLQNGLSSQMIEIHQPIRLCLLVICSLPLLIKCLQQNTEFSQLAKNQWITLSVHNTEDQQVYIYQDGKFSPYIASNHAPSYFHLDEDIFNQAGHLSFGHLTS